MSGSGSSDIFKRAKGAEFAPYADFYLGVVFTSLTAPKCLCPFHEDKSPSFSVKVSKNFGHCFGCGATVDLVDFTAKVLGITQKEAAEKIVSDCNL